MLTLTCEAICNIQQMLIQPASIDHPCFLCFPGATICTEIHFIRHAETSMNAKPELIAGRSPSATLTNLGNRQARALGIHLRSAGMDFDAVYSSPLERAKQTAYAVCQVIKRLQLVLAICRVLFFC